MPKSKRGGAREGSGRPKLADPKHNKISVSFTKAEYLELKKIYPGYGDLSKVIASLAVKELMKKEKII